MSNSSRTADMDPRKHPSFFKIMPGKAWNDACSHGAFAGSSDDVRDGFIHLSAAHQLAGTLAKYFAGRDDFVLVAYRTEALGGGFALGGRRAAATFPASLCTLANRAALWQRPLPLGPEGAAILDEDWFQC